MLLKDKNAVIYGGGGAASSAGGNEKPSLHLGR